MDFYFEFTATNQSFAVVEILLNYEKKHVLEVLEVIQKRTHLKSIALEGRRLSSLHQKRIPRSFASRFPLKLSYSRRRESK